jgi:uncharacterized protein (DUF58 family)
VLLSAVSLASPSVRAVLWGLDTLLLAAFLVDWARTPSPRRVVVDRLVPERVGLSRDFVRTVALACEPAAGLALELHERFPEAFHVRSRTVDGEEVEPRVGDPGGGPDRGVFSQAGELRLSRAYRSDLRGAFHLGALRLRVTGRLGLVQRQARFEGRQAVRVEPALANLRQTLRLAASERWQDLGVRFLRRRGGETEFESLREYVHGDDVRRVDWKAFARRGKPMIRQYQVERGQELILLIDGGRRMRITTAEGKRRGWTKLDWALDAALQLAAVALAKGDRVGAATFARGLTRWVVPAKSSRQLTRLSEALFELQPSEHDSDLARALRELAARHRRRATVVLVSDVADPYSVNVQRRALAAASSRHRIVFAALDDPGLRTMTEGAEGEGAPAAVRAAALELAEDRERALRSLRSTGVRVLDALPAEAAGPLLAAWLDERRA